MKKVVLQRDFQGQDSSGAFIEQVTIDENKNLDYNVRKVVIANMAIGKNGKVKKLLCLLFLAK